MSRRKLPHERATPVKVPKALQDAITVNAFEALDLPPRGTDILIVYRIRGDDWKVVLERVDTASPTSRRVPPMGRGTAP